MMRTTATVSTARRFDLVEGEDGDLGDRRADELRQEAAHVGPDEHDHVVAGLRPCRDRRADLVAELGEVGGADGGLVRSPPWRPTAAARRALDRGSSVTAWMVPASSPNCSQRAPPEALPASSVRVSTSRVRGALSASVSRIAGMFRTLPS